MKNIIILLSMTLLSLVGYGQQDSVNTSNLISNSKSNIRESYSTPDSTSYSEGVTIDHYNNLMIFYDDNDICIGVSFVHPLETLNNSIKINNKLYVKNGNLKWIDYQNNEDIEIVIGRKKSIFVEVIMPLKQ